MQKIWAASHTSAGKDAVNLKPGLVGLDEQGDMNDMTIKKDSAGLGARRGSDLLGANSEIGRKLKQYYDDLVSEQIPDRFAELLSKLEQAETGDKKD